MGFVLTAITIMLTLDGLWVWLSDRMLRTVRGARGWRLVNVGFVAVHLLAIAWIVLGRLMNLDPAVSAPKPLVGAVLIWHLIVLPASLVLFTICAIPHAFRRGLGDVGGGAAGEKHRRADEGRDDVANPSGDSPPPTSNPQPTRRAFLRTTAVMTPPLITTVATIVSMPQLEHFRVRRLTLDLPTLPPALDGMTIAHVTDVHVGRFTHGPVLDRIVVATNDLDADLVLLTGDLINDSARVPR